jgi:hypothetical protein
MKKLILLAFLFVVACGTSSDESSILDKSSCNLPCWNNIVAGQTTEAELLKILENLPDIDQKSIQNENRSPESIFGNKILFSFHQGWTLNQRPKIEGESRISNNTVSDLIICGEIKTSIGELVEVVGEPENIISGDNFYGGRTVILTNPQNGVSYWYTTELNNLEITPDTQIDCLKIFDPLLYEEMLEAKFFSNGYYNAEETLKVWYPWNGYGNLDEKYPPRQP